MLILLKGEKKELAQSTAQADMNVICFVDILLKLKTWPDDGITWKD